MFGDDCSQDGPFKPWPLSEIREEPLKRAIVDRIIARRWRTKWTFGGGVGICYMSTFKADGQRFGVAVWQEFDKWIGKEQSFKYRINVHDVSKMSEFALRQGAIAGPLVFETTYRAEELFRPIHEPHMAKIRKMITPAPLRKNIRSSKI